ncbi:MAG: hypothetical protein WCE52_17285 [Candidatus Acidiferrum sp.]
MNTNSLHKVRLIPARKPVAKQQRGGEVSRPKKSREPDTGCGRNTPEHETMISRS